MKAATAPDQVITLVGRVMRKLPLDDAFTFAEESKQKETNKRKRSNVIQMKGKLPAYSPFFFYTLTVTKDMNVIDWHTKPMLNPITGSLLRTAIHEAAGIQTAELEHIVPDKSAKISSLSQNNPMYSTALHGMFMPARYFELCKFFDPHKFYERLVLRKNIPATLESVFADFSENPIKYLWMPDYGLTLRNLKIFCDQSGRDYSDYFDSRGGWVAVVEAHEIFETLTKALEYNQFRKKVKASKNAVLLLRTQNRIAITHAQAQQDWVELQLGHVNEAMQVVATELLKIRDVVKTIPCWFHSSGLSYLQTRFLRDSALIVSPCPDDLQYSISLSSVRPENCALTTPTHVVVYDADKIGMFDLARFLHVNSGKFLSLTLMGCTRRLTPFNTIGYPYHCIVLSKLFPHEYLTDELPSELPGGSGLLNSWFTNANVDFENHIESGISYHDVSELGFVYSTVLHNNANAVMACFNHDEELDVCAAVTELKQESDREVFGNGEPIYCGRSKTHYKIQQLFSSAYSSSDAGFPCSCVPKTCKTYRADVVQIGKTDIESIYPYYQWAKFAPAVVIDKIPSQIDTVVVWVTKNTTRQMMYTAMNAARKRLMILYSDKQHVLDALNRQHSIDMFFKSLLETTARSMSEIEM
eukprot:TRINITY_DN9210_c0_g1_i1.p1 TRINITY_DN9210_c0_g1~~TRINITY_DN9210_c0_g1_i1.p1  ORF type:complete len:641 (-),score=55.22 TRINITY_DN9210_c0_g1_i1:1706-3628(-)